MLHLALVVVLVVVAVYFGLVYLVCGLLTLSKKLEGGNMTWKEFVFAVLISPLFVAFLILLSPVKVFKGLKKELKQRRK